MADLLLALAFAAALGYGWRVLSRLDRFLDSGRFRADDDDT